MKTFMPTAMPAVLLSALLVTGCGDGPDYVPPEPPTPPEPPKPPAGYVWTELPEYPDGALLVEGGGDLQIVTHGATFGGTATRNFTMLYDRVEKVSHWVAYPMHRVFIEGTASRRDNYSYDPSVPRWAQSPSTDEERRGYGGGWQRGHQIAAADRNSSQFANDQTFYITNMTPQNGTLNGGEWASLEGWVRTKAKENMQGQNRPRYDTLYVVTGCWLGDNPDRIDNRGSVAIPEAYYKVLLRTASGERAFPSDDDCQLVGFWYENRTPANGDDFRRHTMSVAEIERRTGHTFFPSISAAAKTTGDDPANWGL